MEKSRLYEDVFTGKGDSSEGIDDGEVTYSLTIAAEASCECGLHS